MSKGGRRRTSRGRSRRSQRSGQAGRPDRQEKRRTDVFEVDETSSRSFSIRRRRKPSSRRGPSVYEQMAARPAALETLDPDGLELDALIGDLQAEYGVQANPQEYRITVTVGAPEPAADEGGRRQAPSGGRRRRSRGRRRRGRAGPAGGRQGPGTEDRSE